MPLLMPSYATITRLIRYISPCLQRFYFAAMLIFAFRRHASPMLKHYTAADARCAAPLIAAATYYFDALLIRRCR